MTDKQTIVIIEDSKTQSAVIADIVARLGFIPRVYNEITLGVPQLLSQESPVLVLLDLRLLDTNGNLVGDGFQICREIKRIDKQLPVVIVSSESDEDASEWAILQGANAFVQKPFVADDLKQTIAEVLGTELSG